MDGFATFIMLFALIDPIGTLPVFLAATRGQSEQVRKKIALQAVGLATAVLIFFIIAGEIVLILLGISLPAFQISGGILLFLFALTMVFGESKPEQELHDVARAHDKAVFPLAIPSIASPGAILGVVLLTENDRYHLIEQMITTLILLLVLLITLVLLWLSVALQRIIRPVFASLISRVMGMLLAAIATTNVLEGIVKYAAAELPIQ